MYWVLVGFGMLFFLAGIGCFYSAYTWRRRVQSSFSWPTVPGRVLKSKVGSHSGPGARGSGTYAHVIEYEYTVDHVVHTHDHIEVGGNTSGTRNAAEKSVANYPVGREVRVYYDPKDASNACLERRSRQPGLMTLVGVAGCGLATPMVLYALDRIFRIW